MIICGYQRVYITALTADDLKENVIIIKIEVIFFLFSKFIINYE